MKNHILIRASIFSLGLALFSGAPSVLAQQMDHSNMPGMNMPRAGTTPSNAGQGGRAPAATPSSETGNTGTAPSGANPSSASAPQNPSGSSRTAAATGGTQARAARPDRN